MDIDRALSIGLPFSRSKLEQRREKCKTALLKVKNKTKLLDNVSPKNVFESEAVLVSASPDRGRYIIVSILYRLSQDFQILTNGEL